MTIALFINAFTKTEAAKYLDAVYLYPLSQGLSFILSSLMAIKIFKEKINFKGIFGVILAFIGLLFINVL